MANIKQLVENKTRLDYPALCKALIEQFGVSEPVNWNSILPAPQQRELFGGEVLSFVETHPHLVKQYEVKDQKDKLFEDIKVILDRIMNPASHASGEAMYDKELQNAITRVHELKTLLESK